jgi:dTDP-glucose 4,6-dehydratase
MSEKVFVLGSNSFSGAQFVDHCLEEGIEAIGASRSEEPSDIFLPYKKRVGFKFHQLDLNKNLAEIMDLIGEFRPDYVVNFAAQSMVAQSWENPDHWFQTNTLSNVLFHDELRKMNFLKKYVHVSTPEVYGSCQGTVTENQFLNPSTPYAVSRAAADMSLKSFYHAYNFPVSFTRAANVYGAGQQLYRIIPRSIIYFLTGKKLQLHGGGHSTRSFIHMKDVARGTLAVARSKKSGEVFHFSTERTVTIRQLVEMLSDRLDVAFEDCVEVVGDRLGKDGFYLLDSSKAQNELDWKPSISLEVGIEETVNWVKENLETINSLPLEYIHKP